MDWKKNDTIELTIADIAVTGEGIGRAADCTFFVKNALPGDTVRAVITKLKKGYGYAKMLQVLVPSQHRVEPSCPEASRCGGCQIMQLDYQEQLRIKEDKVRNNLMRIGGLEHVPLQPVIGMTEDNEQPLHFRNKMQFPVGLSKDGHVITGFYAGRTHYLIEAAQCPVAAPETTRILQVIREFAERCNIPVYEEETGKGLLRHILIRKGFATGQIMVCLVINGTKLEGKQGAGKITSSARQKRRRDAAADAAGRQPSPEQQLTEMLLAIDLAAYKSRIESICLNINRERTNVILGSAMVQLYGPPYIEDRIGALTFRISAQSFFQVNGVQTVKLYEKALAYAGLTGEETVWDLYCGTGTISLFLAQKARQVYGVEIVPQAIENAKENARLNGIQNVEFFCGKSEEIFAQQCGSDDSPSCKKADVVVLDPPRKGCDPALLNAILKVLPQRIVYVSCDSATLARDIKILSESYALTEAIPVDMFPHTLHVETVVLMSKNNE